MYVIRLCNLCCTLNFPRLQAWELLADGGLPLPNDDHTHYWCRIFKAPDLNGRKHHMIGRSGEYCA